MKFITTGSIIGQNNLISGNVNGLFNLDTYYIYKSLGNLNVVVGVINFDSLSFLRGSNERGPTSFSEAGYSTSEYEWLPDFITFSDTGVQTFTIPRTGKYRINVAGARGGEGSTAGSPGAGANIIGDFDLSSGQELNIIVGQSSSANGEGSGGGGGSFVWDKQTETPLIVAGGGGGVGDTFSGDANGVNASTGTSGTRPRGGGPAGGQNGEGGGASSGGGGGGFLTDGSNGSRGQGGQAALNGGLGGNSGRNSGGFGGGGGENSSSDNEGGGGGGGYSGGGGGDGSNDQGGGGGGSFISNLATNVTTSDGNFSTTGSEPHPTYSGPISNGSFNSSVQGFVILTFLD